MREQRFFYGYVIIAAGFFIQMIAFGVFVTFGIFFNSFLNEFGWARALISGVSSASYLLSGLFGILAGRLNDRIGPRLVMMGIGFFFSVGLVLMSQVNALWQLYLFYGVALGIGFSGMDILPLSTVARWFVKRRGMMSGLVKAGAGTGILLVPLLTTWLISGYGWRTAYIIIGITGLIAMLIGAQFLRRDPAQMGLLPDGNKEISSGAKPAASGFYLREATQKRQYWMLCVMYLLVNFCSQTTLVHLVQHAIDLDTPAVQAASIISVVGGVSILGRFLMGSAADKIGTKSAFAICFGLFLMAFIWLLFTRELWMFYLFASIYGFAHGGFFALISPLVADLFGLRAHGGILGTVIFVGTVGGAIGPFLAGYIFDITTSYLIAFGICALFSGIGLLLTMLLQRRGKINV